MNGAMTLPWVSTIRLPKISITIRIGISQYFLRTRRNIQNSRRNDSMRTSKLLLHRLRRRPRRLAHDPVTARLCVAIEPQRVLPGHAHQEADRRDGDVE